MAMRLDMVLLENKWAKATYETAEDAEEGALPAT
jgi:hypothetical protein